MEIAVTPPMTPPMTALLFELCLPINTGEVAFKKGLLMALLVVGPLAEMDGTEKPSILPGPTSGESINI
jgi:hypothetical protein